ncbi:MAG: ABC transporter substrate-binding protein [Xanthobacteraceae bacterium]|jgi:putative tryptophan/tyrosine transport system substrate-binding protein
MSGRREFLLGFGPALALPSGLCAQLQAGRPARIGLLRPSPIPARSLAGLRRGLAIKGYTEGLDYVFVFGFGDGDVRGLPKLAATLVADGADIIVTEGDVSTQAARAASDTIPIVMATSPDPLKSGLIDSLSRPGRNVTGHSSQAAEISGKLLELATEIVPGVRRVAHIANRTTWDLFGAETTAAARSLGLDLVPIDLVLPEVEAALQQAAAQAKVAIVRGRPFFSSDDARSTVERAAAHRLPVIYESRDFVEIGGLLALGVDVPDLYVRVATYLDKIFKGAKPADLPVEQPTKFELAVNMKTAQALGIKIPEAILVRADEVIE